MFKIKRSLRGPVFSLSAAAAVAVLLTLVAGALVYRDTQKLVSAGAAVEHTQEVLGTLQTASQNLAKAEYDANLYLLRGGDNQLEQASGAAEKLQTAAFRLKWLTADNPNQLGNVNALLSEATELTRTLKTLHRQDELPRGRILRCDQVVGLMAEQERQLLELRHKNQEHASLAWKTMEVTFVALRLFIVLGVFGLLLRGALLRQRTASKLVVTNQELALTVKALNDQASDAELLALSRDELQLCVTLSEVFQAVADTFSRLLPTSKGSLGIINSSRNLVEFVSSWGGLAQGHTCTPESCCGLRSGQARWRIPERSRLHCTHFTRLAPDRYVCIPISAHGNTLGMLYVEFQEQQEVVALQRRMDSIRQVLQLIGVAVASLSLRIKLENQSIRDPLTNLFNRHFMEIALERELARAARQSKILAVFMLDVDHFKDFNDTHGHQAGDEVLHAIADVLQASVRAEDIVCRYGGEEFTIILPDMTHDAAQMRAESICQAVNDLRVTFEQTDYAEVAVSIGIALFPEHGKNLRLLMRRADEALYQAKGSGRNRALTYNSEKHAEVNSGLALVEAL